MTNPNKPRSSPLLLLGDGLLLLCAVVGLAGSFLTLYASAPVPLDLYASTKTAAFCGWGALFALLALGAWSLPKLRALAAGGLAAVWLGAALWWREPLLIGVKLTYRAISRLFTQRVGWGTPYAFGSGLTTAEQLAALELSLLLALALLALILGWAVVRGRCWWLTVLLTLPLLLPGLMADLFPNWTAFMALCACWCTMLLSSLCQGADPVRRGWLTLTVLPAVALVLAGLTLALPREGYVRPAWTYAAQDALVGWSNRAAYLFEGWEGPFRAPVTYVGSAESVDLAHAGPLDFTGRTVLRVRSDYTGRLYLRGTSLAVYDGGSWSALPGDAYQEFLDHLDELGVDGDPAPLLFPVQSSAPRQTYTATVENIGAGGSCVYAPYQLVDQDWAEAGVLMVEDAFLARRQGQWTQTLSFSSRSDAITSFLSRRTDAAAEDETTLQERAYWDHVEGHYLDVPEDLRPILDQFLLDYYYSYLDYSYTSYIPGHVFVPPSDIGAVPIGPLSSSLSSLYDYHDRSYDPAMAYCSISSAMSVADILNDLCRYDPATPPTPAGRDFVGYFLTESRQGYCMHFASAAVLLLRTMGIPARYVSGFTVDTQEGKLVDVPDRAAHAWVEIYLDGYGWYPVEVTPNYDWDSLTPSNAPDVLDPSEPPSEAPEESSAPEESAAPLPSHPPQDGPDGPGPGDGPAAPSILIWALAAPAGAAALLWLGQYLLKRLRAAAQSGADANRAALYSYRCLLRLERWGGEVDEEALALAQKARFSQHTLTPEERQTMADKIDAQRQRLYQDLRPIKRLLFRYWWGRPKRGGDEA